MFAACCWDYVQWYRYWQAPIEYTGLVGVIVLHCIVTELPRRVSSPGVAASCMQHSRSGCSDRALMFREANHRSRGRTCSQAYPCVTRESKIPPTRTYRWVTRPRTHDHQRGRRRRLGQRMCGLRRTYRYTAMAHRQDERDDEGTNGTSRLLLRGLPRAVAHVRRSAPVVTAHTREAPATLRPLRRLRPF